MTFSAIKHVTYSALGGFTAGAIAGVVLSCSMSAKVAGKAVSYFPQMGPAFALIGAISRAVDEVFKALGWTADPTMRLFTAHLVVCLAMMPATVILVGEPEALGRVIACALSITSFAINLMVN